MVGGYFQGRLSQSGTPVRIYCAGTEEPLSTNLSVDWGPTEWVSVYLIWLV